MTRHYSKPSARPWQTGFTLLEVMIAMAVLAIALVGVFQLQSQSISMATDARFVTIASLLAQGKMAEIEAATSLRNRTETGDFGPDHTQYAWSLVISDTKIPGFKRVQLDVFHSARPQGLAYSLVFYRTGGG